MIIFNGVSSDRVRLIVEQYPARPVPQRKHERFQVPGRNGDVVVWEDAWDNVQQDYDIYLSAEDAGLPEVANRAVQWLMVPGYQRLEDEYDRDSFRMALFVGPADLANTLNQFGRATISFDCWPQRFLKSGAEPVRIAQGASLTNPSIYTAEPLIVVEGAGSGVLTVGASVLTLDDCNGVTLDSREQEAWRGVSNLNTTVHGDFPKLPAGETPVSWSGGITGITITPRWFYL